MNGARGHLQLNLVGVARASTNPLSSFLASAAAPSPSCPSSWFPQPPLSTPSPSFPSSWLLLSALSPSFPFSLQWLLSWFQRRMPWLFFFCISGVMNISLSCCNMIAWQQALLCNAEHLFGVINKIAVFYQVSTLLQFCKHIRTFCLFEVGWTL